MRRKLTEAISVEMQFKLVLNSCIKAIWCKSEISWLHADVQSEVHQSSL